jgi:hypothetical protein
MGQKYSPEYYAVNRVHKLEIQQKSDIKRYEKISAQKKEYRKINQEMISIRRKAAYAANREFYREQKRKSSVKNHDKILAYHRRLYASNIRHKIAMNLRSRLGSALKAYGNGKKFKSKYYGIDFAEIIKKLGDMPHDGKQYHIDHIRPLCSFDLSNLNEIKKAFAPENHRWLEARENLIKGGRYDEKSN